MGDVAAANPDTYFIVVDSTITDSEGNPMSLDNVYTMTFSEQESGFFAGRIGQVIVKFIPYALCGVGMCFMYASNRFSMFGEGSYLMSGCFVTIAAFALEPYHLPLIVMVPILLVVGAFFGGLIGFTPAILGAKLKLNELVTSTMLNYVCLYLTLWILKIHLADPDITFFASKILPRMVLASQFTVCFFDFLVGCTFRHTQDLIGIVH